VHVVTDRTDTARPPSTRQLACAHCGEVFSCNLNGACWCMDEAFVLPMPSDGGDCLCPTCLRAMAQTAITRKNESK
jgi:hypothetical protein